MGEPVKLRAGESLKACCGFHWKGKVTLLAPLVTLPILVYGYVEDKPAYRCIYLIVNMAVFWILECIPLYITALFPIVFLPLFDILPSEVACRFYYSDTLVMFLAGLIIALSIEYSNLHKRIALSTILIVGCSPRRLFFGLVVVTTFLSMWISNSAATAMMCPIVKAVLQELDEQKIFAVFKTKEEAPYEEGEKPYPSNIALAFYVGIAYSASIGGCGTLIGTGTNLTFKGIYETRFPHSEEQIDFPIFMAYTVPLVVLVNVMLLFFTLQVTHMGLFRKNSKIGQEVKRGTDNQHLVKQVVKARYAELGPWSCHQIQVTILFSIMIFLLFSYRPGFTKGWSDYLNMKGVGSSAIISLPLVLLFALPTQYTFFKYCCGQAPFIGRTMDACLSWTYVHNNMPWGLTFLIGGGFALAEGSKVSGMAKMMGDSMSFMMHYPTHLVIGLSILMAIICTTAFSSNVAVCNILLPIYCEMAIALNIHPLLLTYPPTLAMSMAFILPVSTPPNAIVSSYGNIKTKNMAMAGILPTCWAFLLIWLNAMTWGRVVYPNTDTLPDWAKEEPPPVKYY